MSATSIAAVATDRRTVRLARLTGVLLLAMAGAAMLAELGVRAQLVVPGDALATAAGILASPELFRLGFLGYLVAFALDVPVAVLLYVLLRDVNRTVAMVTAAFRLVYTAVVGAVLIQYLAASVVLAGDGALADRASQAMLHLDLFDAGFSAALVFFGLHLAPLGWLLVRSRCVPAWLGWLVAAGGSAYVADGVLLLAAPAVQAVVAPGLMVLAFGELVLAFWLVTRGMRPRNRPRDGEVP